MVCVPALKPESATVAELLVSVKARGVALPSIVTLTVPVADPEEGVTVTVKVTSVPVGTYTGVAGDGALTVVVVVTAVPVLVPDRVSAPTLLAAGSSVTTL